MSATASCCVALLFFSLASSAAFAQRLPIRTYTTVDGLASDRIANIVSDPRGFLWFCTANGVSRFDGDRFTTYGPDAGLPYPSINDLLITRDGRYLLASNGGGVIELDVSLRGPSAGALARAREDAPPAQEAWRFRTHRVGQEPAANRVNALVEDQNGRIWAGTDGGLFALDTRTEPLRFVRVPLFAPTPDASLFVWSFAADADGSLWIGTAVGLARRLRSGRVVHYRWPGSPGRVLALIQDRAARVWIGHDNGLSVLVPHAAAALDAGGTSPPPLRVREAQRDEGPAALPTAPGEVRSWTNGASGLPAPVTALTVTSAGRIWIAGADRLAEFDGRQFQSFDAPLGGLGSGPLPLREGPDGHIWAGTLVDGALRFGPNGLVTFTEAEGSQDPFVNSFATREGQRCAFTADSAVSCYDGRRFAAIGSPAAWRSALGGMRAALHDRAGRWWIATRTGIHRFAPAVELADLPRTVPQRTYRPTDGFAADNVAKLYEDSRGDVWIATLDASRHIVARWDHAADRLVMYSDADGLPAFARPLSFADDRTGALWIGFREGGLVRYQDGRFERYGPRDRIPPGDWISVHVDRAGRLWIATAGGGVLRVDRPDQRPLDGVRYTRAHGLSTDQVLSLAEDGDGRIYLGTTQGLNRLDPATGSVRRYTRADGLSASQVAWEGFVDGDGLLWFRGGGGLSRLMPVPDRPSRAPRVAIAAALVGEQPAPLSALGEPVVDIGTVPTQGPLQIDFDASSFDTGGPLRYQYRLEGADEDWSRPSLERSVRFARLTPGSYRLLVRAVTADGVRSPQPASVTFRVLPPVWQRWWFLMIAAASMLFVAYSAHRYRVGQLIALERMRSRLATDLHDEVGSSLSQIAVLSEVARRRLDAADAGVASPLARIADVSRESVGAMSEIVWAIDPERDRLVDLEHRMRRFANDVLAARDIVVRFPASEVAEGMTADADIRREVFLIFKEAVNNIVRHADATDVHISLHVRRRRMTLTISDNGRGFDAAGVPRGLGLRSMRERARRLGGELTITSGNGSGTRVDLTAPLRIGRSANRGIVR